MKLFRPIGIGELKLIVDADFRRFPPRLPEQPIFYPVLNIEYAVQIARDWNTRDAASGYVGYVTAFEVDDAFALLYPPQMAGASMHKELWVPAEELEEFNSHICGKIAVVAAFVGEEFRGALDSQTHLPTAWPKEN